MRVVPVFRRGGDDRLAAGFRSLERGAAGASPTARVSARTIAQPNMPRCVRCRYRVIVVAPMRGTNAAIRTNRRSAPHILTRDR